MEDEGGKSKKRNNAIIDLKTSGLMFGVTVLNVNFFFLPLFMAFLDF